MQLREIHIDGFGIFCDKHVTNLTSGVNVLYGPNEFGKSTLLAFIRRILFGFRTTSSVNPYPAVSGGVYGGRIICQLANGKIITISRKQGRSGGPVEIITDSTQTSGQEELNRIIGRISEKFYENVYAIGIDELHALETFEEEEVKNHIAGAGLELGSISLTQFQNTFRKQAEEIFKPSGSVQVIPTLYKELREKEKAIVEDRKILSKYDELINERNGLQADIELMVNEVRKLEQDQQRLQNQQNLFPTYIKVKNAKDNLANIAETPIFSEDALAKLDKLEMAVITLDKQNKQEANELVELEQTQEGLLFNEKLVELESSIISLQKQSEHFKSASQDIGEVTAATVTLNNSAQVKIEKLGSGWTEEKVRNFNLSHLQEDQIRVAKDIINGAKHKIESIKSKLEAYLDSKAQEKSREVSVSPSLRNTGYASLIIGATGFILGFIFSQPALSIFSACLTVVGLILTLSGRKTNPSAEPTSLERKYAEDLSSAESELTRVTTEWQEQLRNMDFTELLSPDGAVDVIRTIKEIHSDLNSLDQSYSRIKVMQDAIDKVNNLINQVVSSLDKTGIGGDVLTTIEILTQQLNNTKSVKSKKESCEEEIGKQQRKLFITQEALKQAKNELQEYIESYSVSNVTDFKITLQLFREREALKKTIEECRNTIQSVVGIDEQYDTFLDSIAATEPATVSNGLEALGNKIKEVNTERDEKIAKVGSLQASIDVLLSKDLAEYQAVLEAKRQQLCDYSADWVKSKIALFALEKAISKYENTRQPVVIKAATDVFSNITHHEYPSIIKTTGTNNLIIQDNSANRKTIKEMSRGTREQLYFAMRLGLISVYENESEPMPIIMDDILVNFDDGRGPAAIEGLVEFAENRQVIVLTCHKNTLDIYTKLGASKLTLK